jgi:uncharacterized membrane protein HdeD (DUF308 family)
MFVAVGVLALVDAPSWSFLVPLALGVLILIVYGRRAAAALGIRSRDETPHGWLMALAILLGGLAGHLAAQTGRYGGLIIVVSIALAQIVERIVWARFRAERDAD